MSTKILDTYLTENLITEISENSAEDSRYTLPDKMPDNKPDNEKNSPYAPEQGTTTSSTSNFTPADAGNGTADPQQDAADPATANQQKKQMNPWLAGTIGAVLGVIATSLVLNGSAFGTSSASREAMKEMENAVTLCGDPTGISISDEGRSLIFDAKGEEDLTGASYSDLMCVLAFLELPEYVLDKMTRTTALAGSQSATWNNYQAEWSYHPDRGMDGSVLVVDTDR